MLPAPTNSPSLIPIRDRIRYDDVVQSLCGHLRGVALNLLLPIGVCYNPSMAFQGETGVKKEGKQTLPVQVQLIFHPDKQGILHSLPVVAKVAEDFFATVPSTRNVFVIEMPQLFGLNIPHFYEWHERTGRFFEGYLQHTRTGIQKKPPYTQEELINLRRDAEEAVETWQHIPRISGGAGELSFYGALLMLDSLCERVPFELLIEPGTHRDVMDLFKAGARFFEKIKRPHPSTNDQGPIKDHDSLESFLGELRREKTEEFREAATIIRTKTSSFYRFFNTVIDQALASGRPTRIFVPRIVSFYSIDNQMIQNRLRQQPSFSYNAPQFINCSLEDSEIENEQTSRFLVAPNAELTIDEVAQESVVSLLSQVLNDVGYPGDPNMQREIVWQFAKNHSPQELRELLLSVLTAEGPEGWRVLLESFDKKAGTNYVDLLEIQLKSEEIRALGKTLSDTLREALEVHRRTS